MYVDNEKKSYLFLREENLRYTNLTRIFQKLGLHHRHHINAKFSKTMCAYFILREFAAIQTSKHTYLEQKTAAFP